MKRERTGEFERELARKERRRLAAKRRGDDEGWFGLGMFGLVGWSFAIPTLVLLGVGIWIDATTESAYSWALMFLGIGVVAGAANAWFWISTERQKIEEDHRDE